MSIATKYLFIVSMDVTKEKEALFNEVYDTEHVPLLLKVPGVRAVTRWKTEPAAFNLAGERKLLDGGSEPNYADYRIMGPIMFLASVGKVPALAADDPLRDWIERCRDLFGGIGRHPGLMNLYGLDVPAGGPEPYMRETWRGGIYKRNTGPASTRAETAHITNAKA